MSEIEVRGFKLSSGEEIITRVLTDQAGDDYITVDRPNIVGIGPSPDGTGMAVQLMGWLATNQDGTAKLYTSNIVAETEPHDELEKGYLTRTSGIALALA